MFTFFLRGWLNLISFFVSISNHFHFIYLKILFYVLSHTLCVLKMFLGLHILVDKHDFNICLFVIPLLALIYKVPLDHFPKGFHSPTK